MCVRRLILVDGNAALYRAFFAIPPLSTSGGLPTNAVFGFVRMIRQLRRNANPSHLIVTFDGGLSKERLDALPAYKAQRPRMPELLAAQFAPVQEYLGLAGIPWLRIEAEEADDVMATLAAKAEGAGAEVLLFTSDKDMFQLVSERVRILLPPSKGAMRTMDADGVAEKMGVRPEHVVQLLSLMGDRSDNIPGVPGVGRKTAAGLIARFGNIERIWENLDAVASSRIREALRESFEAVRRNARIVRLRCDLACDVEWDAAAVRAEDSGVLAPFFRKLELRSLEESVASAMEGLEPDFFAGRGEQTGMGGPGE